MTVSLKKTSFALGCIITYIVVGISVASMPIQAQQTANSPATTEDRSFYIKQAARNESNENIIAFVIFGSFDLNDVINIYTNNSFIKAKVINREIGSGKKDITIKNISLDSFYRGENTVVAKIERKGVEIEETPPFMITIEAPLEKPTISVLKLEDDDVYTVEVAGRFELGDVAVVYLNDAELRTREIGEGEAGSVTISFPGIQKSDLIVGDNFFQAAIRRDENVSERSEKSPPVVIEEEKPVTVVGQCIRYRDAPRKIINRESQKYGLFGGTVALKGATLAVGSGENKVYLYSRENDMWTRSSVISEREYSRNRISKTNVAIADESMVYIGVPYANYRGHASGAVHMYKKESGAWGREYSIIPETLNVYDLFGSTVAIDRNILAIAAQNRDTSGSVYLYTHTGSQWAAPSLLIPKDTHEGQRFGESVSINGGVVAVGAPGDSEIKYRAGAVYVYTGSGHQWESVKIVPPNTPEGALFGSSVLVRGDMLFVGAPRRDKGAGAVYVYERNEAGWNFIADLTSRQTDETEGAKRTKSRDLFGTALAAERDILLVGAPGSIIGGDRVGAVYIYSVLGRDILPREVLTPKETSEGERFGGSLSSDGLLLVVGADGDDTSRSDSGAVYTATGNVISCDIEEDKGDDGDDGDETSTKVPAVKQTDDILVKRKDVLEGIAGSISSIFTILQGNIRTIQDEVVRREERIVIFDEDAVSVRAQQRAAELRGITAPAIPEKVPVKNIVLGDDVPEDKETIRPRDTVIEETRKETGVVVPTSTRDLKVGDTSEEVYKLQVFLNENGYVVARGGPGSSGNEVSVFGVATERALKSFQLVNGIPVTGMLDEATRNIILTYVVDF